METEGGFGDDIDRAGVEGDFGDGDDGDEDDNGNGYAFWVALGEEDVGGNFILDVLAEHEVAGDGDGQVEKIGEDVGVVDGSNVFFGMPHVTVDVREHAVATPWGHEKAKGQWQVGPALGP